VTDDQDTTAVESHDDQLSPLAGVIEHSVPRQAFPHGPDGDPRFPNSGGREKVPYVEGSVVPSEFDPPDVDPEAVATVQGEQRRLLSERSSNVDAADRPHFQRLAEGEDPVCGQCGKPFPCPTYLQLTQDQAPQVRQAGAGTLTVEQAAAMFNLPVDLVRERLAQQQD
jgi:hypothetical protein